METLMNRKEFLAAVAIKTGRALATISQCLYTVGFLPTETKAGKGRYKHLNKPYYNKAQIEMAADLVLRKDKP